MKIKKRKKISSIIYPLILILILIIKHYLPPPLSALLRSGASNASAFRTSTLIYKEHSVNTRIKALTILNNKVSIARIIKVISIG
jgi:hypothetical protein